MSVNPQVQAEVRSQILSSAQAETHKRKILSDIDTRVSSAGALSLNKGALGGHEGADAFVARSLAGTGLVMDLLRRAFFEKGGLRDASLAKFRELMKDHLLSKLSLPGYEPARVDAKIEKILDSLELSLKKGPEVDHIHLSVHASLDATRYQSSTAEMHGGVLDGLMSLAREKGRNEIGNVDELRSFVIEGYHEDILRVNASRCLAAKGKVVTDLGLITTKILSHVNDREKTSASKTSKQIAADMVAEAKASSDLTPSSLKHPLASLWVLYNKSEVAPISFAEFRSRVVFALASALHKEKHYDAKESIRKAEHIFSYLSESIDIEAVKLYSETYRSYLPVTPAALKHQERESVRNLEPTLTPAPAETPKYVTYMFRLKQEELEELDKGFGASFRVIADQQGIAAGKITAEKFTATWLDKADFKKFALHLYERAVFNGDRPTEQTAEQRQLVYKDIFRGLLGDRLDSLANKDLWLDQAAAKFQQEIRRKYPEEVHTVDLRRLAYGNQALSLEEAEVVWEQFFANENEARFSAKESFKGLVRAWTSGISTLVKLKPASPDLRAIKVAFDKAKLEEMARSFFQFASATASVADFKIALTSSLMAAFSGTPAMDECFHSTEAAREASRTLIETLVDDFTKLADLDVIREPIQARSVELQVDQERSDKYIRYREAQ